MDYSRRKCLCLLLITAVFTSTVTSQDTSQSFAGGSDEYHPKEFTNHIPEGRQDSNLAEPVDAPTIPTDDTVKSTDISSTKPLDGAENGLRRKDDPQTLVSLVFVAAVVALCIVGCVAFVGGMYCWHKHADITSSARRVLYRSSDSSVLIHNDYQPMGDRHEPMNNGNQATNNDLSRLAEKTDYPAYGVTGPNPLHYSTKGPPIDVNLNRSAEVYHYQQQKQKLKSLTSSTSSNGSSHSKASPNDAPRGGMSPGDGLGENLHADDEENSDGEYTVYECPGLASTTDGPMEIHNPLFADSDSGFSSFSTQQSLGGGLVATSYDFSTKVGGRG